MAKPELGAATALLKSISESTEARFLEIGNELKRAIGPLEKIAEEFDALAASLGSDALAGATEDLTSAAADVAALGEAMAQQRSIHDRLTRAIPVIDTDLSRIHRTVNVVGILATNGKIAAAGIGATGGQLSSEDFLVFAREVDRLVKLAQSSLGAFRDDLTQLGQELQQASQSRSRFEGQQSAAIRDIPKWLRESVDAAASHRRQAAAASLTVKDRSTQVRRRVGEAIMSLQIGDITRQRIEHVEHALGILHDLQGGGRATESDRETWWRSLDRAEQQKGAAEIYRLQVAQLEQTADDLENGVRQIIGAMTAMAEDAREILRLSSAAFGAADNLDRGQLGTLEENVDRALGLLRRFKEAQDSADATAVSVQGAVERSTRHMETVRSLEVDLRLLGLNMTFRCDRLGSAGRALSVVAQELRACADQTTEDARAVVSGLDTLTATAREFSGGTGATPTADLATVETVMSRSLDAFRGAGERIAGSLTALLRDGEEVAKILEQAAGAITFHDQAARKLRRLAGELATAAESAGPAGTDAAFKERLLLLIDGHYTMASERAIHDRFAGSAPAAAAAAADSLENILF